MLRFLIVGLLFCWANLSAEPVKIKQAIGSVIRTKGKIQTGSSSRTELELPYFAIIRVGSNADLKFSPDAKKMLLKKGTMLLSMAVDTPEVSVESGSVVTAMSKGDFEMLNVGGRVKVITLNGKVTVALAANPSDQRRLRFGDMVDIPAGATSIPPITAIKLSTLLKTSILFNMGPLPSSRTIRQNATKQAPPGLPFFVTGGFDPDWGGGGTLSTTLGPAGTAAMVNQMEANITNQRAAEQAALAARLAAEQAARRATAQRIAQQQAAIVKAEQERMRQEQANQGRGPQGNQGQGNQGQGNMGQGNQGQGQGPGGGGPPGQQ